MKHRGMKILSLLLSFVLVLGLMPGMSMTVYAANEPSVTISPDGGGTVSYSYNSSYDEWTLTAVPAEGYSFEKWTYNWDGDSWELEYISLYANDQYTNITVFFKLSTIAVTGVTLNKTSATLAVGGTETLTATVAPDNVTDKKVKWSVGGTNAGAVKLYTDENCTTEVGAEATENLTVYAKGMSAGSATVTATSNANNTKSASCAVTVNGYTVHFDPNGGDGQMEDVPNVLGEYTLPGCDFKPPEGKSFKAWSLDGTEYAPGAPVNIGRNTTFVAVWQAAASGGAVGFGGGDDWYGGYVTGLRAYRVSLAPMQGGSAALVLNTGESGETMNVYPQTTVRVVPSPAPGYKLASIVWSLIDGSASYDITQSQTFVMPAMDAVVHVTFVPVG